MLNSGGSAFARSAAGIAAMQYAGIYKGPEVQKGLSFLMQFLPPREHPDWINRARATPLVQYSAGLLLRLAGESSLVIDGYTHQDLGEMLGTYRETTTQVLNKFKDQGWIEIGRKNIKLLNTEALLNLTLQ